MLCQQVRVIWIFANLQLGGTTLAERLIGLLNPLGLFLGLNGVILLAYVAAIPANEIVIPTILMLTVLVSQLSGVGVGAGLTVTVFWPVHAVFVWTSFADTK